jgi:hypothetical protein
MEAARLNWTDSRLDDLTERVTEISKDLRHQSDRIDALQHTIITVGGGLIAAMLTVVAALLGTMVTLLVTHF